MVPENNACRNAKGPFADTARRYRAAGFLGTLPLPAGQKEPPPSNFTGGNRPHPTDADVRRWRKDQPDGNIALRLAGVPSEFLSDRDDLPIIYAGNNVDGWELIGVDVDDYGEKHGGDQLAELEAQLGDLPATVVSSARWDAAPVSGTRVFLVPQGYKYHGKAKPEGYQGQSHIDILYRSLRYLVVWPSVHPDGGVYEWRYGVPGGPVAMKAYDSDGTPPLGDVAVLPEAWLTHLMSNAGDYADAKADLDFDALDDWAETAFHDCDGEPCKLMAGDLARYIRELDESDQHTPLTDAVWRLTMNAVEGHAGWHTAVTAYLKHWVEVSAAKRAPEELSAEWQRSLDGAMKRAKAMHDKRGGYVPDDPCAAVGNDKYNCDGWAAMLSNRIEALDVPPASGGDPPSWSPVDVRRARSGVDATPPTILKRSDGACLFYRRKVHSVHGESESGKSWLVQCATAECLLSGESVLYIDFEDEAGAVAERLIRLGVPSEIVDSPELFVYVHPEAPPTTGQERASFDALLRTDYTLAVVDGVTDAMGLFGLSGKDADDVAKWQRVLPKTIARTTGAAVVCVDHVAKDSQTRGRFALGSQHKMAGLSGAAYVVEMEQPFAVGQAGRASVRVGKDRPGRVRGLGGRWRKADRTQHIADLHLDSTDDEHSMWALELPEHAGKATDVDDAANGARPSKKVFRPTWFMEQVSRYWEETGDPAERTSNKTVDAMCAERKEQGKTQHRQKWRDAIKFLVDEGFARTEAGARHSEIHVVVKPYRQLEDPLCDEYSKAAVGGVEGWKHKMNRPAGGDESGVDGGESGAES